MRNWVIRARLAGWCLLGGWVAVQQAFLGGAEIPRSPTPPMDSAEVWVERLGNSDFIERQRAMERLSEMGKTAVEPLRKALASEDAEVRFRARYLLRLIRESHRASSIEAFLAGDTADASDELPGWSEFQEITGTRPDARQLYAQMLQDEGAFLDSVYEAEIPQSARLLSRRTWELHQDLRNGRAVSVSSVGALLLVASGNQIDLASQTGMMSLCYRTEFDRAIRGGPLQQPLRALLGRVVAKNSDESMLAQRLHFSLHYDLPEGLEPARQVLANRGGLPHIRQYAVLVVAKLGKEEVDDQLLQRTLDDPAEVAAMHRIDRRQISTQVRDIALAALVHRSRQPFSDYGLADVRQDATLMFQTASVGFESEEAREKAMESWKNRDPNKLPTNSPSSPDSNSDIDAPPGESTEANKAEVSPD